MPKKGYKQTEKHRKKIGKMKLGNKNPMYGKDTSQKQKDAARKFNKKRKEDGKYIPVSEETREKIRQNAFKQFKNGMPETTKEKIRQANKGRNFGCKFQKGKKNPSYIDGRTFEPYGIEFNNKLKEKIRKRDNYKCSECKIHQNKLFRNTKAGMRPCKLYIHHIDYNKKNNKENNLISLCLLCHSKVHYKREEWEHYFKSVIVQKI